jgi:hypothetical protein
MTSLKREGDSSGKPDVVGMGEGIAAGGNRAVGGLKTPRGAAHGRVMVQIAFNWELSPW